MTDPRAHLEQLIAQWRERADQNEKTPDVYPMMADDLKAGALIWAMARRECADQLAEALALVLGPVQPLEEKELKTDARR